MFKEKKKACEEMKTLCVKNDKLSTFSYVKTFDTVGRLKEDERNKSALFFLNLFFFVEKRSLQASFFKFLSLLNSCCAQYS